MPPSVFKVCLTGGPCSGKTTACAQLTHLLKAAGYRVLTCPEIATILINGGCIFSQHAARPKNGLRPLDLEANVIVLQRAMEEAFDRIAAHAGRPCIILYDRGILDVKAYMHDSEWAPLCSAVSLKEEHIMGRYDVVFHLVTAAKGAEGFYTNANNTARLESVEEARRLDDSTMQAWAPYAERRLLIDNSSDMQGKIRRIADHVMMRLQKASL
ncbi:TRPL translocation defect protein 14 [Diplonema papillatum]|nr:TRPL translocation defect protein 14 [Diplonema papillatum]